MLRRHYTSQPSAGTFRVQFVVFEHNQHQIRAFVNYCESMRIDYRLKEPYFRNTIGLKPATIPGFARVSCDNMECIKKFVSDCPTIKDEFAVLVDGSVVPCCYDYNGEIVFGNLFDQDVMEIWDSPIYTEFREKVRLGNVPDFCMKNCLMFHNKMV